MEETFDYKTANYNSTIPKIASRGDFTISSGKMSRPLTAFYRNRVGSARQSSDFHDCTA
jgi:hypothetical protein